MPGIVLSNDTPIKFFLFFLPFGLAFWRVFWLTLCMNKLSATTRNETMNEYSVHLNVAFLKVRATSEDDAIESAYALLESLKVHLIGGNTEMDIDLHGIDQTN
jgi:hypothetical protein